MSDLPIPSSPFGALREQLLEAAKTFADGPDALADILTGMVDDVDHALREPLEIFPVCHHSPASALAMARRLREKQPKVIYLELCEDLQPLLQELQNCRLPVALQAFASELDGFPSTWGPLSVVAPITEASAEYQAIAYALTTRDVEIVLVDRSTDHVFQWDPHGSGKGESAVDTTPEAAGTQPHAGKTPGAAGTAAPSPSPASGSPASALGSAQPDEEQAENAALHGEAVGIQVGHLRPRFGELEEHLLRHGKVQHWSEWWDQYVEQPLINADYDTYRQVMALIGSLFRRLTPANDRRLAIDEERERYMWTRIREHLAASGVDRSDCIYVCGAFHAVSRVAEFGSDGAHTYQISPRTKTRWLYGVIPSSYSAIEAQFGHAPGTVSIAAATWNKALKRTGITPFRLQRSQSGKKPTKAKRSSTSAPASTEPVTDRLSTFLASPPLLDSFDEAELLGWCVEIVRLARDNGYLASTADAIAVFETSILLANMRGRRRPTPYDFTDAAITCIEKDSVPKRRDVRRLCEILFGGDRVGRVGYDSLPPLARDVYDRLAPLGLALEKHTLQRALLDLRAKPELQPCSDLLWRLRYLLPPEVVRPIMGERHLGKRSIQESWDLGLGKYQRALIELGYEGVTVEQVLEKRLRQAVHARQATAATALAAVEDSLLYLDNPRLTDNLGARAVRLLAAERTVDDAPEVLRRIRRLLAYYRANQPGLPDWFQEFVTAGYAHYCTLLPTVCLDEQTTVEHVAAVLGFLFSMENLALSLGCDRTQLELAVLQSHPETPGKQALIWAAQHLLGRLSLSELRERCDELLANPLVLPSFPQYLSGFVQALEPAPALAPFVVELISKAFARLPDSVLLPWLPTLLITLRNQGGAMLPRLIDEAGRTFPARLSDVDSWVPPWERRASGTAAPAADSADAPVPGGPVTDLLIAYPASVDAVANLLGCEGTWRSPGDSAAAGPQSLISPEVSALLADYPATAHAAADLLLTSAGR